MRKLIKINQEIIFCFEITGWLNIIMVWGKLLVFIIYLGVYTDTGWLSDLIIDVKWL